MLFCACVFIHHWQGKKKISFHVSVTVEFCVWLAALEQAMTWPDGMLLVFIISVRGLVYFLYALYLSWLVNRLSRETDKGALFRWFASAVFFGNWPSSLENVLSMALPYLWLRNHLSTKLLNSNSIFPLVVLLVKMLKSQQLKCYSYSYTIRFWKVHKYAATGGLGGLNECPCFGMQSNIWTFIHMVVYQISVQLFILYGQFVSDSLSF